MFWRFGSEDDRRPVAATVCRKEVCTRPAGVGERRQRVDVGSLELRDLAVLENAAAGARVPARRAPSAPRRRSTRTSSSPSSSGRGSSSFSKRIWPSWTGELTLNSSPASSQIFCSRARRSFSMRADISFRNGASIATPKSSMRASTGRQRPLDLPIDLLEVGPRLELAGEERGERRRGRRALGRASGRRPRSRTPSAARRRTTPASLSGEIFCPRRWKSERLDLRAPDPGGEDVLGKADVEEVSADSSGRAAARRRSSGLASGAANEAPGRSRASQRARIASSEPSAICTLEPSATASRRSPVAREERHAAGGRAAFDAIGSSVPSRRDVSCADASSPWISAASEWNSSSTKRLFNFSLSGAERLSVSGSNGIGRSRADRGETPGEERVLGVLPQALADLALDLAGPREELVEAAVLGDPLLGRDLAHARNARDVVRGVAHERQHVDDLPGRDPEELDDALLVEELLAARVEDADPARPRRAGACPCRPSR